MQSISPQALKPLLTGGDEIAFLDVREHGLYGEGHPFFSLNMPYSELEYRARLLLPCKSTFIVLADDNDQLAQKVFTRLRTIGYTRLAVLQGGIPAWQEAGYNLFKGVNVPSKTFGELVEHETGTPSISAEELNARINSGETITVLDGRSPAEFHAMTLPFAQSCPNIELAHRAAGLFPDEETTVVINCAGRTRSIIGAEILRQCHLRNPVYALRNGTQGWKLAGFDLHHGETPQVLPALTAQQLQRNSEKAIELNRCWNIPMVLPQQFSQWLDEDHRTTYLLDVRTLEEFSIAHWPGARHAPGGQLVQATDEFVAVRGARIVLCDDAGLRAVIAAMWLRGMGHDASVLQADVSKAPSLTEQPATLEINSSKIEISEAALLIRDGAILLDVSRGMDYRKAHVEGAVWATRSTLDKMPLEQGATLVVTGNNPVLIAGVVNDLVTGGYHPVHWCDDALDEWEDAGFTLVATPNLPSQEDCIDYLFFVHDRHAGNMEAARQYLEWETGLLAQLDEQERGALNPPSPARG